MDAMQEHIEQIERNLARDQGSPAHSELEEEAWEDEPRHETGAGAASGGDAGAAELPDDRGLDGGAEAAGLPEPVPVKEEGGDAGGFDDLLGTATAGGGRGGLGGRRRGKGRPVPAFGDLLDRLTSEL